MPITQADYKEWIENHLGYMKKDIEGATHALSMSPPNLEAARHWIRNLHDGLEGFESLVRKALDKVSI